MAISNEEYRRPRREALLAGELTDAELDAIAETDMAPKQAPLDREIE